jgi:hypothetical protein
VTPLVDLLRSVPAKTGEIVIRPMPAEHADEFLGLTIFRERSAYIADDQDATRARIRYASRKAAIALARLHLLLGDEPTLSGSRTGLPP